MTKYNKYFRDVSNLTKIDIYRILELFGVTNPCKQHAIKKLLLSGDRTGGKSEAEDIQEAIDTLTRWQEMKSELLSKTISVHDAIKYNMPFDADPIE
jgi:hypothetical protein